MFRKKIAYKLIFLLLLFALIIIVPYSLTILTQAGKMIEEHGGRVNQSDEYIRLQETFVLGLVEQMVPYAIYILILAIMMTMFFMRNILISMKELQRGSQALKDGNLDINLRIVSNDELGYIIKTFNEMAAALKEKTIELKKKDEYIKAMLDPLWVVDNGNNLLDVNPAFTRLFGYSRDEVTGSSIYDFFDEKNAAIMHTQLYQKMEEGMSSIYEISILAKDGSLIPVLISGGPVYINDRIYGKISVLKDFREQSELRTALRQSRDYLATIMDSIQDELLVIDRDYKVVKANKAATLNLRSPIIGEPCHEVSHRLYRPCWTGGQECPAKAVFRTGRSHRTTHRYMDLSGGLKYHEVVASPVRDSSGDVINVVELLRDVTERAKNEEEISRKNRELVALNSISGIFSRSLSPDEIFTEVLDKMIEMMNMDGGGIFFINETGKEMICRYHRGISDEYVKKLGRIRVGEDIPGKVAVSGQIVTSSDISQDIRSEKSMIRYSGIKGYCCIPIKGKAKILGVFCLFNFKPHVFTGEEENILKSIGDMTGIALENIKLYEEMRALYEYQRKRREEEHTQLLSLSTTLGSAIELKHITGHILALLKDFFRADFAWLLVSDDDRNFILKSATAIKSTGTEIIYRQGTSTIEGYSIEKKMPTVIQDIRSADKFYIHPEISALSFCTAVSVPMYIGDKSVGAYALYYHGRKDFKEEEIHFLQIIANFLAVAIERSDFYLSVIRERGLSDAILQSVTDSILTVDNNRRVISVNRAFERNSGIPSQEAVGLTVRDVFNGGDENTDFIMMLEACLEKALAGKSANAEGVMIMAYGNTIPLLISSDPVLDAEGEVIGAVNLLRDISREKEIDGMKTGLIRSVSHEFRTPLSAIVGMTEMMLDGDIEEKKARKYLGIILNEGIRLSNMVSDLLSIAKIESGKESLKLISIDMEALLIRVIENFSSLIEKKGASVKYTVKETGDFVGDEGKLKQLLVNFIDNSLAFSDAGCSIEITVSRKEDELEIIIADNGWGIPEEDLPHLPERFFRGLHGEKVKGTGLGLSICSEIIKMHDGRMDIKSELGKGTEVVLYMPYRRQSE